MQNVKQYGRTSIKLAYLLPIQRRTALNFVLCSNLQQRRKYELNLTNKNNEEMH